MSSVIPRNCDDVIVNFCLRSQTIVKLKEFKEDVEERQSVVLSDEQAKTLFRKWLKQVYSRVDGQQVFVDVELDNDDAMDSNMDHFWDDVVNDNLKIPDDWQVARCQTHTTGCNKISVGTYGDDKVPLCEEHKVLANYDDEGNLKPEFFDGCEHPSPEVKEVAIVSNKATPVKEATLYDKTTEYQAQILALKAEVATLKDENTKLKDRIRSVVKHFEQMIASII